MGVGGTSGFGGRSAGRRQRTRADSPAIGRAADRPGEIPPRGWLQVARRVKREISNDHLDIVAGGIGFYLFLAVFPALIAAVSIYGLVADPGTVESQIAALGDVLPAGALEIVRGQLGEIVRTSPTRLGWGAAVSIVLALWSAARGAKALIAGVNIAYDEHERRGWLRLQATALAFTLGFLIFFAVSLFLITVVPNLLGRIGLGAVGILVAFWTQWALMLVLALVALAIVYRYAPSREEPRWSWIGLGSFVAAGLWLAASILFSWYARRFGSFNETYGAIAGVVLLLLWLQITGVAVLVGAELNAELEHQTARDSTTGPPEPMGERGAVKADTLPPER